MKILCTVAPTHPEVQFCQRKHSGAAVAALSQRLPFPGVAGFSVASAENRNMARTGRETQSLHRKPAEAEAGAGVCCTAVVELLVGTQLAGQAKKEAASAHHSTAGGRSAALPGIAVCGRHPRPSGGRPRGGVEHIVV